MDDPTGRALGALTTVDVGAEPQRTLLVPLGATEQHGPHLPLDTDTRVAVAWADAIAAARAGTIVAPPLAFGSSGEHQDFAGTLSIGQEALDLLLVELVRSAARSFAAVALVSGHAGNAAVVERVVARMRGEGHRVAGLLPRWDPDEFAVDAHAGRVETSLMLHIAPETVAMDRAEAGTTTPLPDMIDRLRAVGVRPVAPNGILGDPRPSTAEEGARLFDSLMARSLPVIDELTGA